MRLVPAELAFDADGTPYAPAYGDVYHSAESGPGQAEHVFLGGNGLPRSWARARAFTIVETGFGLGLNFLATWRRWRADPERCERLHFVSIEKHPFSRDALAALHRRYGEFAQLSEQLREAWPPLVAGMHRLHFEDERVALTLAFADATALVPRLRLHADAIYLDGFAPRLNPDLWSPQLLSDLARLARPGTTVATYSSAGAVRAGLEAAGFAMEKCAGFGRKRDMLRGTYAARAERIPSERSGGQHAIVIGAGIAGAAVCERLAQRGWDIELIESRPAPDLQAPARYAGVFHPHVSRDDSILSRAARNGFLNAVRHWLALERSQQALTWSRCGVLQLAGDPRTEQRMMEAIAQMGFPAEFAQFLAQGDAEKRAGCALASGGWWFPGSGWMRPMSLIAAQLARAGRRVNPHFGTRVEAIAHSGGQWQALAADGRLIAAAPLLVLANSNDMARLAPVGQALQQVRGQVSYLPEASLRAPRVVLTGSGYVLPPADAVVVTGSTYDRGNDDPEPQLSSHAANLLRLGQMLPQARIAADAASLDGAVGFRCVAPDRLPLVGALPDVDQARARKPASQGTQPADLARRAGLYCAAGFASRGLVWAALAGEMLASMIEGEPLPLEGELADALDPGRFALRQARRGKL